jgi:hypothetical protein
LSLFAQQQFDGHVAALDDGVVEELEFAQDGVDDYYAVGLFDEVAFAFGGFGRFYVQSSFLLFQLLEFFLGAKEGFNLELDDSDFPLLRLDYGGEWQFPGNFGILFKVEVHVGCDLILPEIEHVFVFLVVAGFVAFVVGGNGGVERTFRAVVQGGIFPHEELELHFQLFL